MELLVVVVAFIHVPKLLEILPEAVLVMVANPGGAGNLARNSHSCSRFANEIH